MKQRVVYCIPSLFAAGGTERVVINKANYLVAAGYDVVIVTTDQDGRVPFFHIDDRIIRYDLGINYYKNSKRTLGKKLFYYVYNRIVHKIRLRKLLKKLCSHVVISLYMNEMSILPYIKDGSKKILEFHFSRPFFTLNKRSGIKGLVEKFQQRLDISHIRKYDRFVVLSEEDKRNWSECDNISVIYNASSVSSERLCDGGDVIAVGRLTKQKGFHRLVDVWAMVPPPFKLRIFGDGELREDLLNEIRRRNLSDRIFIEKPVQDIKTVYENSSILVMTSVFEGLPMVMIEAQSCGLPVVAFDFPCGPLDVINDGEDGFIIPNGDIDLMAKRITTLLCDAELRRAMSFNAKKNSLRFDSDIIMKKWITLFGDIVKQ